MFSPQSATKGRGGTPLTARRLRVMRSRGTLALAPYPEIPCRRSSLTASLTDSTSGPATSTRSPSYDSGRDGIHVMKLRNKNVMRPQIIELCGQRADDDPFVDKNPRTLAPKRYTVPPGIRYRPLPRELERWSSDSWCSSELSVPSFSSDKSRQSRPFTTQHDSFSPNHYLDIKPEYMCPLSLPITFLNAKILASKPCSGRDSASLWATVQVSAKLSSESYPGPCGLAPLEVVILLDQLVRPSESSIAQMSFASVAVVSHLVHEHDRIALAVVNSCTSFGFEILLPLGFHSVDIVRSCLERFAERQHSMRVTTTPDLGIAFQHATKLFGVPSRPAFCHLFYVSTAPPDRLCIPRIDHAVGIHTISPLSYLPMDHPNASLGWHISFGNDGHDDRSRTGLFLHRVSQAIGQLRTGIRPGSVSDVKVSISAAPGCLIEAGPNVAQISSLRPGETWAVEFQVRLPSVFQQRHHCRDPDSIDESPLFKDLMSCIDDALEEYNGKIEQPVVVASVHYRHSLLPPEDTIHTESHLTVTRKFL